jgi:serine/threonine-protein kinase
MSPEQLRGEDVDHRTDIWSLGVMIYEMVTGRLPFKGDYEQAVTYSILNEEPEPMTGLRTGVPMELERIVAKAMAKEPAERYQHVDELPVDLKAIKAMPRGKSPVKATTTVATGVPSARRKIRGMLLVLLGLIVGCAGGAAILSLMRTTAQTSSPPTRFVVSLPPNQTLMESTVSLPVALSPDGTRLVYVAESGGGTQLYLRPLDQFEAKPIAGTEGAINPFFSPDGQWVGFYANGRLQKAAMAGGTPLAICTTPSLVVGASWGTDDNIIFAVRGRSGLFQVSVGGDTSEVLTTPDKGKGELSHRWPQILPDGKGVLFTVWTGEGLRIAVLSLATGESRILSRLGEATGPRYVPTGHLVYAQGASLLAVPFDLARLEPRGSPVSILDGVTRRFTAAYLTVSHTGSLVYVPGGGAESTPVWVDREGQATPLSMGRGTYTHPRISPDGRRVAVDRRSGGSQDIWIYDIARGTFTRLTVKGNSQHPVWTPDGKRVTFNTYGSDPGLYWKQADGKGVAELLWTSENVLTPVSWSPGGRLAFEAQPSSRTDIWVLKLAGERTTTPFLTTPFNETSPMFSPDGHWLAYVSDESGRQEVYVQPYPGPGEKWPISIDGGTEPVWSADGRELFYRNGEQVLTVAVEAEPTFTAGKPRLLFEGPYLAELPPAAHPRYHVSPDGQRFLMIRLDPERASNQIHVVLNWFEELKSRVPGDK